MDNLTLADIQKIVERAKHLREVDRIKSARKRERQRTEYIEKHGHPPKMGRPKKIIQPEIVNPLAS